jgi:hypothetical protein
MDGPDGPHTLPWEERMHRTFDLIINALKAGRVVLLHCKAGRHRARVVGGTFLAIVYDVPWSLAMSTVIEKRRGYNQYFDKDENKVQEIASALDLQDYVREYRLTDGWANVAGFSETMIPPRLETKIWQGSDFLTFRCSGHHIIGYPPSFRGSKMKFGKAL